MPPTATGYLQHEVGLPVAASLAEKTAQVEAGVNEALDLMVGIGAGGRRTLTFGQLQHNVLHCRHKALNKQQQQFQGGGGVERTTRCLFMCRELRGSKLNTRTLYSNIIINDDIKNP